MLIPNRFIPNGEQTTEHEPVYNGAVHVSRHENFLAIINGRQRQHRCDDTGRGATNAQKRSRRLPQSAGTLFNLQDHSIGRGEIVQTGKLGQITPQITFLQLLEVMREHAPFMTGSVKRGDLEVGVPGNRRAQTGSFLLFRISSRSSRRFCRLQIFRC